MKLTELIPEIEVSGYGAIPICEENDQCYEILIVPPNYKDEQAAIGVKESGLYYRIAPAKWFRQPEDREELETFLNC